MNRFNDREKEELNDVLLRDSLWPYSGGQGYSGSLKFGLDLVSAYFEAGTGKRPHVVASSSGTASIHIALAGLRIPVGSEVIVPPITDMGTIMPIIYQNAIPVFADLDPETGLLSAASIQAAITPNTSAVIVVHLAGSPANMPEIMEVCRRHDVKVIEDVAQALGAHVDNVPVGMHGDAGCFSLNSWKHVTVGEGGFVLLNDEETYRRCLFFSDKHRNRLEDKYDSETYAGPGLNYRLSQIEGAMLRAQWPKLSQIAQARNLFGTTLDRHLTAIDGIQPQKHLTAAFPTFFGYMFRVKDLAGRRTVDLDPRKQQASIEVNRQIRAAGIRHLSLVPHPYTQPMYFEKVFQGKNFFNASIDGSSYIWPAEEIARARDASLNCDYKAVKLIDAEDYYANGFWLRMNTENTSDDADQVAQIIHSAFTDLGLIP